MILPDLSRLSKITQAMSIDAPKHSLTSPSQDNQTSKRLKQEKQEAQAYFDKLPKDLRDVVLEFTDKPSKSEFWKLCRCNQQFNQLSNDEIKSNEFWRILCIWLDWQRPDRTTGVHALPEFTWRKQFFRWCKLYFAANGEELRTAVTRLLDETDGTGRWNYFKEYSEDVNKYGPIETWDVSKVTNMDSLFFNEDRFNADLSKWDVSRVVDMMGMFHKATSFNADLSKWDVSNVINMHHMFSNANTFNADISEWDVSSVENMVNMFYKASAFNNGAPEGESAKPLEWNVSRVVDMFAMFADASSFNADISTWDVSNVMNMQFMFEGARSFNVNLSMWKVTRNTNTSYMFDEDVDNLPAWYSPVADYSSD